MQRRSNSTLKLGATIILLCDSYRAEYILSFCLPCCIRHLGGAPIGRIAYRNKQNGPSKTEATLQKEERSNLLMVLVLTARSTYVLFRLLIKGFLATHRTKVVGLSFVFRLSSRSCGVNIHVTYWVMYCICHTYLLFSISIITLSDFIW